MSFRLSHDPHQIFLTQACTVAITGRRPMTLGLARIYAGLRDAHACRKRRRRAQSQPAKNRNQPPERRFLYAGEPAKISSIPAKDPAAINRMLEVSISMNSWWGCLRPPEGGTEATVPSMIFSSACCTPSPETSRVIEGSRFCARSCRSRQCK